MARKPDVRTDGVGKWDEYANVTVDQACERIFRRATDASRKARDWYWSAIGSKRNASLRSRAVAFALLVAGAALPLTAALAGDPERRLLFTQLGVAALAVAGLLQAADRIFGWSSGWLRYMTTVTAMEAVTRTFELDWAAHILGKTQSLDDGDKKILFELAKTLEADVLKLQTDETDRWVGEFNSSLALLNDLIRSQRESADKTVEAARGALETKEAAELAKKPGAIELALQHKDRPQPVKIRVDGGNEEAFTGTSWAAHGVPPGMHTIQIITTGPVPVVTSRVLEVPAGGVARLGVELQH